ncbi:MAG: DUF4366 domain-containing protein [Eubacteriales bacterium]|nr:DUF4366 domain-containing protein [Eubacteriales bacterium]
MDMAKLDEVLELIKKNELLRKKDDEKKNCLVWILAIVGAVAVIAAIAYAVYRYMTPDYLDDFDDDFEDDDLDEEAEAVSAGEAEAAAEPVSGTEE